MEEVPPPSPYRRSAKARREQRLRAEARSVQRLLAGFTQLVSHRGSQPTRLGAALHTALAQFGTQQPQPPPPLCRHYLVGKCTYGSSCRFSHSQVTTFNANAADFVPMDTSSAEAPATGNCNPVTLATSQSDSGPGPCGQDLRTSISQPETLHKDFAVKDFAVKDHLPPSLQSKGCSVPAAVRRRSRELSPQVRLKSAPAKPFQPDEKIRRRAGTPRATPPRAMSPPRNPSPLLLPPYAPSMPSSFSGGIDHGRATANTGSEPSTLTGTVDATELDPAPFLELVSQVQAMHATLAALNSLQQPPT